MIFAAHIFALADAEKQGDSRRYAEALKAFQQFVADNALQQGSELQAYIAHYKALAAAAGVGVAAIISELDKIPKIITTDHVINGSGNAAITQRFPDGSGQSGRPAPGPTNAAGGRIIYASGRGATLQFRTVNSGRDIYQVKDFPHRRAEAEAWIAANVPNAQHGAIVLPRTGGTRVNVGEAGRAEAIVPLPDLAALAGNLMAGVGGG